ncbi:hypothetical protein [Paenibacillus sp. F411]|uniref:DUF7408 domain-containing protein n=1 Tax=Paenibacillus sp. F411 TaxID=2820239 RepID=UPI001FBC07A4|nr:hypothetical protein [Paenibacillus sp. F411]
MLSLSMIRKGCLLLTAILLLAAGLAVPQLSGTANAAPQVEMQTELGYEGVFKQGKWNPLRIMLKSSEDLAGDIVIQLQNNNGMGEAASYVQRVELPKDTEKEIVIAIPGVFLTKDNNTITFYEGSYSEGKPVAISGSKTYLSKSAVASTIVGVLSADPDTMNFLNTLNGKGNSIVRAPLQADDIYENAMLLDGLDVLVMNNFASDTLTERQQESITSWVQSGGTLVLSGGAGYAKTSAPFLDIAPVQPEGTMDVDSLPELVQLGRKPLSLADTLTLSKGSVVEGAVVDTITAGAPLFAHRDVGQGKVRYAAYDVSMEPVSSWAGHAAVWASVLKNDLPMSNGGYNPSMDQLSYTLEFFPSIQMPSFPVLLWMLIIYAFVAAPLLYFILKKADKREWAWFLIPLVAVIASAAVYMAGSTDKTEEMAHTLNIVELDGAGLGTIDTATALFTPRSGDYQVEFPQNTYVKTQRRSGGFVTNLGENKNFIRVEQEQTKLELRDMPQWSLAKMWARRAAPEQTGQFAVTLDINDNGEIAGKVTNETLHDLDQVVLVVGGTAYKVGDISARGTADIPSDKKSMITLMGSDLAYQLYPYPNQGRDSFNRQRDMLSAYTYQQGNFSTSAYVVGWSDEELSSYTVGGSFIPSDQLNLWTQSVELDWSQKGAFSIPYGFLTPQVSQVNATNFFVYPHGIEMGQGSITAEFQLLSNPNARYDEFSIKEIKQGNNITMEIWNAEQAAWEVLPANQNTYDVMDNTERYIVDNQIRLSIQSKGQGMIQMPELTLKGENQ